MSRSAEYREKAVEMMRCARAATKGTERQTYIELAAAWNALARDIDASDGTGEEVLSFASPGPDPRESKAS
jgi:hypothetical protein